MGSNIGRSLGSQPVSLKNLKQAQSRSFAHDPLGYRPTAQDFVNNRFSDQPNRNALLKTPGQGLPGSSESGVHVERTSAAFGRSDNSHGNRVMGFIHRQHDWIGTGFRGFPWTGDHTSFIDSTDKNDLPELDLLFLGEILNAFGKRIIMIETQHKNPP